MGSPRRRPWKPWSWPGRANRCDRRDEQSRCVDSRRGSGSRPASRHGDVVEYGGERRAALGSSRRYGTNGVRLNSSGPRGSRASAAGLPQEIAYSRWVTTGSINGKGFPKTDPILVQANRHDYRVFDNQSDEAHPVHLHRHSFELRRNAPSVATSGIRKDVVVAFGYDQNGSGSDRKQSRPDTVPLPSTDAHGLLL